MKLLRRKLRSFDIQVQDMVLHVISGTDFNEESRAAALSFWEQLALVLAPQPGGSERSKRPIEVPADAPEIVREMGAAARAGVGPMFSFQGAVTDHVGRFLAREVGEVTVTCGGDYFIRRGRRQKLTVHRKPNGGGSAVVVPADRQGVGIAMTSRARAGTRRGRRARGPRRVLHARGRGGGGRPGDPPEARRVPARRSRISRRSPGSSGGVVVRGEAGSASPAAWRSPP